MKSIAACAGAPGPFGALLGSINSDGSFSMQESPVVQGLPVATLTGSVPANGASSWNGHLTLSNPAGSCPAAQSMDFTAVPIGNVTGTYSGMGTLEAFGSPATQSATFSFALQQGAVLPGSATLDAALLFGTVSVQGLSCFLSGTISSTAGNGVLGSEFVLQATMNDGSTAEFLGQIMDTEAQHLSVILVSVSSGTCNSLFSSPFTVTRQ